MKIFLVSAMFVLSAGVYAQVKASPKLSEAIKTTTVKPTGGGEKVSNQCGSVFCAATSKCINGACTPVDSNGRPN